MKEKTNILNLLFVVLLSAALAVFGVVYFYSASYDLIYSIKHLPEVIKYQRGAMYALGGGIAFSCLFVVFSILLFYRQISLKIEKRMMKGVFIGLVLMFAIPIFSGFTIPHFIEGKGYQRCEKSERRSSWPIFRAHIYTDSQQVCEQLIKEKIENNEY